MSKRHRLVGPIALAVGVTLAAAGCGTDGGPWATTSAPTPTAATTTTAAATTTTTAPLATVRVSPDGSGDAPDLATAVAVVAPEGTIVLEAGEYLLAAPLLVDKPLTIRGAGSDRTTVAGSRPPELLLFTGPGDLALESVGFAYRGADPADGLIVDGGTIRFTDVQVTGAVRAPSPDDQELPAPSPGGNGFLVRGQTAGTLERCTAVGNQLHGFVFLGATRVTIRDSTATRNGETGFAWMEDSTGTAEGNIAGENGLHGFDTEGRAETNLNSNAAEDNGQGGFVWQHEAVGRAEDNRASGNGMHGFGTEDQAETTLTGNSSTGNGQCGFRWAQDADGEARRNTAEGNGLCGYWIADAAAPTLINNIARSHRHAEGYGSGLVYAGTAGGVARRNQVYGNDWGIALGPEATPQLVNNDVHDNTRDVYEDAPVS